MRLSFTSKNAPPPPPPLPDVILASQSAGRKMLLEKLGIRFRVAVARIDEDAVTDSDPYLLVRRRAEAKTKEVVTHPRVYSWPKTGRVSSSARIPWQSWAKKPMAKPRSAKTPEIC